MNLLAALSESHHDVLFQELLSLAKRKRVDSGEQEEPVSKPAASTDSETSDSDDEVWQFFFVLSCYQAHSVSGNYSITKTLFFTPFV